MKFNSDVIKFGFKKLKLLFSMFSFPISIGVNLSVTQSQFRFPYNKLDVWISKFHFNQIEGVD